jgi:O-acetyl-ADP-ribose deacetylase (regulator of RNase III)
VNRLLAERLLPNGTALQLVQGDITAESTDAIVNAANAHLQHGGGAAGMIAYTGGPAIQRESDDWVRTHGPVSHEQPAWTSGGRLQARYVIHAVGPVWGSGDEDASLAAAVRGSLVVADELQCASVSLPALSTGIFGFPVRRAAGVILAAITDYFRPSQSGVKLVRVVLFDPSAAEAFLANWGGARSER